MKNAEQQHETAPVPAAVAEDTVAEDVVVTLEHPSVGTHVFRCQESKLAHAVSAAMARGKKVEQVRQAVAAIDAKQQALQPLIAREHSKIAAAEVLGSTSEKRSAEANIERLQRQADEHAVERQKVMDSLL